MFGLERSVEDTGNMMTRIMDIVHGGTTICIDISDISDRCNQWRAQTFWGAGAQGGREGHFLAHAEHLIIKKLHAHVE